MKSNILKIILWTAVISWMVIIFLLSAENAEESIETSDGIVDIVVEHIVSLMDDELTPTELEQLREQTSNLVRKAAHFSAYMLLGILTLTALYQHSLSVWAKRGASLGICVLYAISDEIHQLFVPGRAGQIRDVLIDSSGAVVGIIAVTLAIFIIDRTSKKYKEKNHA